jgi:DNA-binding ferritin-like protein
VDARIVNCPIWGSKPDKYIIDNINLQFLNERWKDNKINAAISLARIVWSNIPQLRLTADSKAIVEGLSEAMSKDLRKQVDTILNSLKVFTETFPQLLEKLPEDVKKDIEEKFEATQTTLEEEFKVLRDAAPTFESATEAIETVTKRIEGITKKKIDEVKDELTNKFEETLKEMGFPEPEQMKLLTQLVPSVLPLLEELLRMQKVPSEKGSAGELELLNELNNYYPEDEFEPLGKSGDTDIIAKPRNNGTDLGCKVMIESKKNNSGWRRSYIQQVQRHMMMRRNYFAILAVEVMPKGANGFLVEQCSEGVIFVTSRENFKVAYGALRSALIALHPLKREVIDLRKVLADKRVEEAIADAYRYKEHIKKIRQKTRRIVTNAKGITQDANDLDDCLKECLKELQCRINKAVQEMEQQD